MAGREFSAIKIKQLAYADVLATAPTLATVKAAFEAATKISNSHQDSFQYEEADPTVTPYKNELTGANYRADIEEGDTDITFSIGKYDMATKTALQGGTGDDNSWVRGRRDNIYKATYALTEDDVLIVFPKANIVANGKTTDKAIALSMKAIPNENGEIKAEYWFDYEKTTTDKA